MVFRTVGPPQRVRLLGTPDHRLGTSNIFLRGSKTETVKEPMEDEEETPADEEEVKEDKEEDGEGAVEEDEEEELEARQIRGDADRRRSCRAAVVFHTAGPPQRVRLLGTPDHRLGTSD